MTIPLRVVQQFYDEEDGTRVWANYRMEVLTVQGWVEVPVLVEQVARPAETSIYKGPGGEHLLKC
jgi:hypothetical protein